jgi:hypothetical protein
MKKAVEIPPGYITTAQMAKKEGVTRQYVHLIRHRIPGAKFAKIKRVWIFPEGEGVPKK